MRRPMKIIAEIGVNHDGSVDRARSLIDLSADCGADYAKFQIFQASELATQTAALAAYQETPGQPASQVDMLRTLELGREDFCLLAEHCAARGIAFLATPFDLASAAFLTEELNCREVKVGSGDCDNIVLLIALAATGAKLIVSTGMSTLADVELAVDAVSYGALLHERGERWDPLHPPTPEALREARSRLREDVAQRLTLLHCTSEYPAEHASLNLAAIPVLRSAFGVPVGLSDHSRDHVAAIASVVLGSTVIERHITDDRTARGPDHAASLEGADFAEMVAQIRAAEVALSTGRKSPSAGEVAIRSVARKKIVAAREIAPDEPLTLANLTLKRASAGLEAGRILQVVGRTSGRRLAPDEPVVL